MSASKIVLRILSVSFSILSFIVVGFILYQAGIMAYNFGYRVYTEKAVSAEPGKDIIVEIKEGMSNDEIATLLEEKQLVKSGTLFYVQLKLSSYANSIIPGVYTLNNSMTARELMQQISSLTKTEDIESKDKETEDNMIQGDNNLNKEE